ncbi:MAG: dienelactone hydrolase family protein [Burkholderiaceae bacterium]
MAGQEITYSVDGTTFNGYLARPDKVEGTVGGVLVVHEWWGHNDYVRRRADMLAELGYVALAVDMYGDGKLADHPKQAGQFAGEVRKNKGVAEKRFRAAMDLLKEQTGVSGDHIGAIGYCFGGSIVLEMARLGLPLAGVASFHGSLGGLSPVEAGAVKARVLVLNGADDPFIKAEQIEAFKKDMNAAGADYQFINYPGALHSFTNPAATEKGKKFDLPVAYDEQADKQSWEAMKELFDSVLR